MVKCSDYRNFFYSKYGKLVTDELLKENCKVINNDRKQIKGTRSIEEQIEIEKFLRSLKMTDGRLLVPEDFFKENVKWGVDFSSWIGELKDKEFMIIGVEPHLEVNYQLVYNFGNYDEKSSLTETAKIHYNKKNDIWSYLTDIFVEKDCVEQRAEFLSKCYITDLCHIVPQNSGQVKDICKKLSIKVKDWRQFRSDVAKKFLRDEIELINPKYILLHGKVTENFFLQEFNIKDYHVFRIEESRYTISRWNYEKYKIIAIPHLKGDMRNKLWKIKKYPKRLESAKEILNNLIEF